MFHVNNCRKKLKNYLDVKSFVSTNQLTNQLTMSISEVMLDRWILENIDDAVPAWDIVEDIDKVNKNWRQSASDELSPEALDLL